MTIAEPQLHSHKEEVAVVMAEVNKLNLELQKKKQILDLFRIKVELYEAGNSRDEVQHIASLIHL